MDRSQYEILVAQCDSILERFREHPAIIAIPWLHVLNNHPNTLKKYDPVFQKRSVWIESKRKVKYLAYFVYKLASSFFLPRRAVAGTGSDAVFISHFVQAGSQNNTQDFYYGALPEYLSSKGISHTTGFIDHTPGRKKVKDHRAGILFPRTVSFSDEWRIMKQCLRAFRTLKTAARNEQDTQRGSFLSEAAMQAISPQTASALRIYTNTRKLIEQSHPSALIITWEGWSWERMAMKAARETNRNILCISYQHTVLFPGSHALKASLGNTYDPDIVLTIGEFTRNHLESANTLTKTSFIKYGSHRATRSSEHYNTHETVRTCLVTPEGIESECVLLFDFAIALAKEIPGMDFIFRTHPVLPFPVLQDKYPQFTSLPKNCRISDQPINNDFTISDFLLYRGSSVVIYAVLGGLRPVYYHIDGQWSIDPLYALQQWKLSVTNTDDFRKAIEEDTVMFADQKHTLFAGALDFCNNYVCAPDHETIYKLLSQVIHPN